MKQQQRKHTMHKKTVIAALVCIWISAQAYAEIPIGGSLQTHIGMFFGGMTEYVYEKGRDQELSRLEWEENFVPYVVVSGELDIWKFFLEASVITAIPIRSGLMRDYDYMLPGSDVQSHYSEHDAIFDKHLEIAPKLGYFFSIGRFSFAPSIGILFRSRKWTATGGFAQYPSVGAWSEDTPKEKMAGAVISYEESTWFPTVSLESGFAINDRFNLGLTAVWYPYLDIKTIDSHYIRKTQFHDTMRGGMGCLAELSIMYSLYSKRKATGHHFLAAVGYEGLFPPKGTTDIGSVGYDTGLVRDENYQSKMESNLFWFSLGIMLYPEEIW
jgi:outer membrane protease